MVQHYCSLQCRTSLGGGDFCGFVGTAQGFVPSLARLVLKILAHPFRDLSHFQENQISLRDALDTIRGARGGTSRPAAVSSQRRPNRLPWPLSSSGGRGRQRDHSVAIAHLRATNVLERVRPSLLSDAVHLVTRAFTHNSLAAISLGALPGVAASAASALVSAAHADNPP